MAATTQVRLLVWSFLLVSSLGLQICKPTISAIAAIKHILHFIAEARLAQSAERKALNLVVVGSSPIVGVFP